MLLITFWLVIWLTVSMNNYLLEILPYLNVTCCLSDGEKKLYKDDFCV